MKKRLTKKKGRMMQRFRLTRCMSSIERKCRCFRKDGSAQGKVFIRRLKIFGAVNVMTGIKSLSLDVKGKLHENPVFFLGKKMMEQCVFFKSRFA